MSELLEIISLDRVISKADDMQAKAMQHAAEQKITEKERDLRCELRDYLYSMHMYLKELKTIKEKK